MGEHLRVERLVRLTTSRMLYLVNNLDPKWATRKCWACGNHKSPKPAQACGYCGTPLTDKRFLMSARWDARYFRSFNHLYRLPTGHAGLAMPVQVFRYRDQLLAFFHYAGERLLVDSSAPLPSAGLVILAHRIAGVLGYLHGHGVVLAPFSERNFLITPEGSVRMFDIDVVQVLDGPVPSYRDARYPPVRDLINLAEIIQRLAHPRHTALQSLLDRARKGAFPTSTAFRDALEQYAESLSSFNPGHPTIAAYTDVGLARSANEDTWRWRQLNERVALYVVADGMGGHAAGALASALASDTVVDFITEKLGEGVPDAEAAQALLEQAFIRANKAVWDGAQADGINMGTTLVAMLRVGKTKAYFANAGDSRAYRFRGDNLTRITSDHSLVSLLVEQGKITEAEARNHPRANVLVNTVGSDPEDFEVDTFSSEIFEGDRFLLCSDGIWGQVEDPILAHTLMTQPDPRQAVRHLTRLAYLNGGNDNVTAIIVDGPRPR